MKRIGLILICFLLFVSNVNAATYQKKCSDYTYSNCPDGKTDERGNTCKAANNTCYFKVIKTTCQNVVPEACSEADGHCCGVDSAGNSCTYNINTKKCQNVATYNRKAACTDWDYSECPAYSDNGTACIPYDGLCQSAEAVKNSELEAQKNNVSNDEASITDDGRIKAIVCTGFSDDQIPSGLPSFTRALYNVLKILVPLFIIFFGIFDFFKAFTSGGEKDMDSNKSKFVRRIIAGILVFFVLAIVQWVFGLVGEKDNVLGCLSCFLTTENDCQEAGYIDPGKNDDNGTPNKTPPKSTNKVSQNTKDDDSSSNSSSNNSNSNSSNNSSSNSNSSSTVNNDNECKQYTNKTTCENVKYCQWRKDNGKCSANPDWYCTQFTYKTCPVGKIDKTGKMCRKYKSGDVKSCKSGLHCINYSADDCPTGKTDDFGRKCRKVLENGKYTCRGYDN